MAAEKKADKKTAEKKFGDDRKKALEIALGKIEKDFFGRSTTPLTVVTRKAIVPTAEEIESNPRSRSAKMRVAEKL